MAEETLESKILMMPDQTKKEIDAITELRKGFDFFGRKIINDT